ncbi:MAG: hypothetical protein QXM08_04390, partial [Thermofilaceae archaeon]
TSRSVESSTETLNNPRFKTIRRMEDCLQKVKKAIELYERARASPNSVTVTELARRISSPRSHGSSAKAGVKAHNVWGDPLQACTSEDYWTPLPLAHTLEGMWIYGVADLVRFRHGQPIEVVELKHYKEPDKYAEAQAAIYAWLTAKLFNAKPKAYLVLGWNRQRYTAILEVKYSLTEVERKVKTTLSAMESRKKRSAHRKNS